MNGNPVVFLDIDGVLNSRLYEETDRCKRITPIWKDFSDKEYKDTSDEVKKKFRDAIAFSDIDIASVRILNSLCNKVPDAEFVT